MSLTIEKTQKLIAGLRVIVVDDVEDSRDVLRMYLMQKQAEVKSVSSAKEALQALESFQTKLIISDIYMPDKDGYWLIEQLHTKYSTRIPAIALTAAAKKEDRDRLIAAGYDGYLSKPFLFEDLTMLITQIIIENSQKQEG